MRKKIVTLILLFTLAIILLTACGGNLTAPRNGTYRQEGLISQTWTFSGTNEIQMSTAAGFINARGTWRIEGNNIYITTNMFGTETVSRHLITEITRNSFMLDGARFNRQ